MERERYVTIGEVMELLSISRSTIYQWTSEQFIPHYKIKGHLRFKLSEIENWMKRRKVRGRDTYKIEIDL